MAPACTDILQELCVAQIEELRDFYSQHLPYATQIYSYLDTMLKWRRTKPDKKVVTIFAPHGDWRPDGTFVALMEFSCYDVFLFTMDKECKSIYKCLKETDKIDFKRAVMFFALHRAVREVVQKAMADRNVPMVYDFITDYWWLPKEKASVLTVECPDEYYIENLTTKHASIVNEVWPHRYEGSIGYVSTLIEMGGGHGLFQKSDGKLVSWILKMQTGTLGLLQTAEGHTRKGLAAIVTKSLAREVGLEGHNPMGTVLTKNVASRKMFTKLGFEVLDWCSFMGFGRDNGHVMLSE